MNDGGRLGGKIDNLGNHLGEKIDAGREENRAGFAMLRDKIDCIKEDTGNMSDTLSFLKAVHRETLELKESSILNFGMKPEDTKSLYIPFSLLRDWKGCENEERRKR